VVCDSGVNVVDVEKSKILEGMTIKTKGGKIVSISKSLKTDMQEEGWSSVDAEALYVCPGLIDCKSDFEQVELTFRPYTYHAPPGGEGEM